MGRVLPGVIGAAAQLAVRCLSSSGALGQGAAALWCDECDGASHGGARDAVLQLALLGRARMAMGGGATATGGEQVQSTGGSAASPTPPVDCLVHVLDKARRGAVGGDLDLLREAGMQLLPVVGRAAVDGGPQEEAALERLLRLIARSGRRGGGARAGDAQTMAVGRRIADREIH